MRKIIALIVLSICLPVFAIRQIERGIIDVTTHFVLRDNSTGIVKTGLTYESAGLALGYRLGTNVAQSVTPVTLATSYAVHSDGGFIEVDSTKCPGLYRVDWPDAAFKPNDFRTTIPTVQLCVQATGVYAEYLEFELTTGTVEDVYEKVRQISIIDANTDTIDDSTWVDPEVDTAFVVDNPDRFWIGGVITADDSDKEEKMLVTNIVSNTLTVIRGYLNTYVSELSDGMTLNIYGRTARTSNEDGIVADALTDYNSPTYDELIARSLATADYVQSSNVEDINSNVLALFRIFSVIGDTDTIDDNTWTDPEADTAFVVDNGDRFSYGDILYATVYASDDYAGEYELMRVTDVTNNTLTVQRGWENTTPIALADNLRIYKFGTKIRQIITSGEFDSINAEADTALTDYDPPTNTELQDVNSVITTKIDALPTKPGKPNF